MSWHFADFFENLEKKTDFPIILDHFLA